MKKKKGFFLALILFLALVAVEDRSAQATDSLYNEGDITWVGNESDYTKTLDAFFDHGLRVAPIGDLQSDNTIKNAKYGLVDKTGTWKAQPVYDEIKAYYPGRTSDTPSTETIFVNGYVQAKKNGKMGLLDSTGKEVIPCKYDAVGLPSEGMCRLIEGDYIGYWNLTKGTEVVPPNKYILPSIYSTHKRADGYVLSKYHDKIAFDYNNGYALVPTGKVDTANLQQIYGIYGKKKTYSKRNGALQRPLVYAQIIDKDGKEVLPKPYTYVQYSRSMNYPQDGPYMVYTVVSNKMVQMVSDASDHIMFSSHLVDGVVGKSGVIVKAKYHSGIWGNAATGWYPQPSDIEIIAKSKLILVGNKKTTHAKEGEGTRGVVNFKGKTVIPFQSSLRYNKNNNVFIGVNYMYSKKGTKIKTTHSPLKDIYKGRTATGYTQILKSDPVNGYTSLTFINHTYNYKAGGDKRVIKTRGVVDLKKGKLYKSKNLLKGIQYSNASIKKTIWVNKGTKNKAKWGLYNITTGKVIIKPMYKDIGQANTIDGTWSRQVDPYTIVSKDGKKWGMVNAQGKTLLPCTYKTIRDHGVGAYIRITDYAGQEGYFNLSNGKVTLFNADYSLSATVKDTVLVYKATNKYDLYDIPTGTQLSELDTHIYAPTRGLFYVNSTIGYIGLEGKPVFPGMNTSGDLTIIVRDNKIGFIHTSRLAREGVAPPSETQTPTETPKPAGKAVAGRYPDKIQYRVGEAFATAGMEVLVTDTEGSTSYGDKKKITYVTADNVTLYEGRTFQTMAVKTVNVFYDGQKIGSFKITVY